MLKSMRRNNAIRNAIIFGIVILLASYVLVSFGQAPPTVQGDTIARVGSTKIKYRDALIAKQSTRNRFAQFGSQMNITDEQINSYTANSLMNEAVLSHGADELGIHVSDSELTEAVINIRKQYGGENGYLDAEQWANFVKYNYRLQVPAFEQWLREKELKLNKFRNLFAQAAFISENDIKERFRLENEKVDVEILNVPISKLRNQNALSDEEIKAYYDAHPDEFMSGPQRQLRYVEYATNDFSAAIEPTEDEITAYYEENKEQGWITSQESAQISHIQINGLTEDAIAKANQVKSEIDGGMSFEEAVTKYSEDANSAARGGDMGNRTRIILENQYGAAFADAVLSAEIGAVIGPLQGRLGQHIVRVGAKQPARVKPVDEVRNVIVSRIKNENGKNQARTAAADFLAKFGALNDFDQAASEMSATVYETRLFDQDNQSQVDDRLNKHFQLRQAAFQLDNLNDVTGLVEDGSRFFVAQWIAEAEPAVLEFEVNTARIRLLAEANLGAAKLRSDMEAIATMLATDSSKTFADVIGDYDYMDESSIIQVEPFNEESIPIQLQSDQLTFADIYGKEIGEVVGPLRTQRDYYMVMARVIDKSVPDDARFEEERQNIVDQLRYDHGNELLGSYVFTYRDELDPNSQQMARIQAAVEAAR
ncbi:MAG: peptidyl-prolyl cis-trans isomerase [Acidobacteria bacterium]|nr:peptidyl-prolyl cis-trans isomerase [Acidobacteriota bacterium]